MATIEEMAEAHLLNVQREIATLTEKKNQIESDIQKLTAYFNENAAILIARKNGEKDVVNSDSV
jgi:hypothetical protein